MTSNAAFQELCLDMQWFQGVCTTVRETENEPSTRVGIEIRDPHFANYIDEAVDSLVVPDIDLSISVWEVLVESAVAVFEALSVPNPVTVQQALAGIAV